MIALTSGGHPWLSGSVLNCWSTGQAIDPAPRACFIMNKWCFRPRFCTVKAIGLLGLGQPANEMNFVLNYAPGRGSIDRPVGQQASALPLYHGCLPHDS